MTAGEPGEPIREVLAEAEGLRVQLVSLAAGQSIPWHTHTFVADMIIAVVGTVEVELEPPAGASRPQPVASSTCTRAGVTTFNRMPVSTDRTHTLRLRAIAHLHESDVVGQRAHTPRLLVSGRRGRPILRDPNSEVHKPPGSRWSTGSAG